MNRIWKWITKHRHDSELCGVLVAEKRYHLTYKCYKTGELFTRMRVMGTIEGMLAWEDEKRERLAKLEAKPAPGGKGEG